jgi:hypothetical protein
LQGSGAKHAGDSEPPGYPQGEKEGYDSRAFQSGSDGHQKKQERKSEQDVDEAHQGAVDVDAESATSRDKRADAPRRERQACGEGPSEAEPNNGPERAQERWPADADGDSLEPSGHDADDGTESGRNESGRTRDEQRQAGAPREPREHIAAQPIGPEGKECAGANGNLVE